MTHFWVEYPLVENHCSRSQRFGKMQEKLSQNIDPQGEKKTKTTLKRFI